MVQPPLPEPLQVAELPDAARHSELSALLWRPEALERQPQQA